MPYSPCRAICDIWLFGRLKEKLQRLSIVSERALLHEIVTILQERHVLTGRNGVKRWGTTVGNITAISRKLMIICPSFESWRWI
jgi:hypothetical protein